MRIGVGNDHAGARLKGAIAEHLAAGGHEVIDHTPGAADPDDDYPERVTPLARAIAEGAVERGIFCCGSGIGPAVAANKVRGIRATVATEEWSARDAVEHVDVNLLTLGERVVGVELAQSVVDAFIGARTEGGRHARRREQIAKLEVERT